ncbi:MAG TPA: Fic family protein [Xanthomonadales bacterium]|nr:Fic family protein [Xanthomonadales bacterium]
MKLPLSPPRLESIIQDRLGDYVSVLARGIGPEVAGVYLHWDRLRHLNPPEGLDHDLWWLAIRQARQAIAKRLPLHDTQGRAFAVSVTDSLHRRLHFLDREAAGSILGLSPDDGRNERDRYLIRSLIEEAMTSAQLEGASTTREVAKDMLHSGRQPRDTSEQMIYNNYLAMRQLQDWRQHTLTPEAVFEIHRLLTQDTLDDPGAAGRFRRADEAIRVYDHRDGTILHEPPPADQLPRRLRALCDFANAADGEDFLHPVLRGIALHFQLGYDHPFVDGNGRTARALFYWSMLRSGYWLTEYLSISSVLKKAPSQYARAFLYTETDGADLSYFADHQLQTLEAAVNGLRDYVARKTRERQQAETLLKPSSAFGARFNHRQRELLLDALRHPDKHYRIAIHQSEQRVTYQTARTDLLGLESAGLLQRQQRGNAYVFRPVANLAQRLEHD